MLSSSMIDCSCSTGWMPAISTCIRRDDAGTEISGSGIGSDSNSGSVSTRADQELLRLNHHPRPLASPGSLNASGSMDVCDDGNFNEVLSAELHTASTLLQQASGNHQHFSSL